MQKIDRTIAFHSNQLSLRGTEVAMYDYADYFERLYKGRSIVVTPKESAGHDVRAAQRFSKRFPLMPYSSREELDEILRREKAALLYTIKAGFDDGLRVTSCPNLVHAVFPHFEPHGDVYAYVSKWLSNEMTKGERPFIPHIVSLPPTDGHLRTQLNIPQDALVLGRHGGLETFDIGFVREILPLLVEQRKDLYFLFANTDQFCAPHAQIIHMNGFSDPSMTARFVQTCDAMLHARNSGETFGMAVAEFAILGKPVLTWDGSKERAHIEHLGSNAWIYKEAEQLAVMLLSMRRGAVTEKCAYHEFTPERVMRKFVEVAGIS